MASSLPTPPSFVEHEGMHFLIFDAPNDDNLPLYMKEFQRYNVKDVVRVCEPTYNIAPLTSLGITVHDWPFSDGSGPPDQVVKEWLNLVKNRFKEANPNAIGIHCVAGLGRAPVLVAIALIELGGLEPLLAIDLIRRKRRGSINSTQLRWLRQYKRR
eukprot:CAMPEP_0177633814 /NCGR_PEP_ID=MMETSP0447-20121125/3040_1 /TAXON_ID=0 /ORGANISM="Stygamoeba regulata, Strain BSH-02190019" /LENGTH=156 /DNA_ID=CAMNT_0019135503 /DNA_START=352 /DNA_END=818 /DNA_ORIENTATION=-